ncbi:glycoside hydrolase family 30 protein [Colwellia piezophila]|uniref:glycoside hydrolase family 30 protein n=1 Tax=Colwellia piezophila TaxID=211668 RepID=UPI00039A487E|nr:glycoside hydrolase family 30 beta sandwich domain-containing protein [Colwellia piezophila]
MKYKLAPLVTVALLITTAFTARSQEISVWQTKFDHGSKREKEIDIDSYGLDQDSKYVLLRKLDNIKFTDKTKKSKRAIVINDDITYQTIQGLGASMTDSSAWLLSQLQDKNPELYHYVMKRLFSEDGAGFSMLRRPIGSSDYTATAGSYTYADKKSEDLASFSIEHDKKYIIPMLKEAQAINPKIKIIGSPWSAPGWMKTNNDIGGITASQKKAGKSNRLKPEYFDLYADYFVNYIKDYQAAGVTVDAITLQNEPQLDAADYPSMRMTVDDQIKLVRALGPKLENSKLNTEIFVHDHNWKLHPNDQKVIGGDAKLDPYQLVKKIYNDPVAGKYVTGSAWHCYYGSPKDMKELYARLTSEFPSKKIYTTEASGWREWSKKGWKGDSTWGIKNNWLATIAAGGSVSLQWNLVLDHKHGPTTRHDSLGVGLVTVNSDTWQSVKFEREFYAMAQVSKAVRPGSLRIESKVKNGGGNIPVLAVKRPDGSIGLVAANLNKEDRIFDVINGDKLFKVTLPSRSISTFIWK